MKLTPAVIFISLLPTLLLVVACGRRAEPTPTPQPLFAQPEVPPLPTLDVTKIAQGKAVYEQHCAACHGPNGEGQPDWRERKDDGSLPAPPHDNTGHTWHHADEVLIEIITNGQPTFAQSQMPVYKDILSQEEIEASLEFLKSWWGPDERAFQWRVTWQTRQQGQE